MELGEVDIWVLNKIYQKCNKLEKEFNWGFEFDEDSGDFETAIEIDEKTKKARRPTVTTWGEIENLFVPDIMDFHNKIIIEYEEES